MSQISTLPTLDLPSRLNLAEPNHRALFNTPSKSKPISSNLPKNNFQIIRSPNINEKEIWVQRARKQIKFTPKVFIEKSTGAVFVESGDGCALQFIKKSNKQIRASILAEVLQCINALGKYYGYFYIDKHMMKISKQKQPLIWIHHNFKLNFREFPLNESTYNQKIFYDNTKRVMNSLIEFPTGLTLLTEMIDYTRKFPEKLSWKNIESQLVSRNSYSTTNGRVYSNLSNSPSGTTLNDNNGEMKTIKSSQMLIKNKSNHKNVVKKIEIKDHHPYLFLSPSKKILRLNSGESQSSYSRDGKCEVPESTDSLTSRKFVPLQNKQEKISSFNDGSEVTSINLSPKKVDLLKPNYAIISPKQRKHSANANTELIKQWISTNLSKKFPYSTFSARRRVTCDPQIQQQQAEPNTPIQSVPKKQAEIVRTFSYQNDPSIIIHTSEQKKQTKQQAKAREMKEKKANKWVDNYGGSNKISWGINSQIAEEEDSVLGDEVDKLFDSQFVKQKRQRRQVKESQLAKQIQNLFSSQVKCESRIEQKKDEYLSEFENILI